MPQLQLPIFPAGAKCITNEIAAECRDKQVVYLYGSLPVFQHAEGDLQSFRLITSQLIDMGAVRQMDIVNAFGVPLPTVKRYLKLLRDRGSKAFFAEPKRRSASVLRGEARQVAERLIEEGRSVKETDTGIKVREQWAARFDKKTGKKTREGQPVKETDLSDKKGKGTPQGEDRKSVVQ